MGMETVKEHFEEEAQAFDIQIKKLIPNYDVMIAELVENLCLCKRVNTVIDLGCGTGTVSAAILERYPQAKITCVDIAEKMVASAKNKLGNKCTYVQADLNKFKFDKSYDVIVSSLALHHLSNKSEKQLLYDKIFQALEKGGLFINLDVILGDNEAIQERNMEKWIEHMMKSVPKKEVYEKWLPAHYNSDNPTTMRHHFSMLENSGFATMDTIWKRYGYAIYCAMK